jgi:hypothetical protein
VTNQSYGIGRQNEHIGIPLSWIQQTLIRGTPGVKTWHIISLRLLATDNDTVHTDYKIFHGHYICNFFSPMARQPLGGLGRLFVTLTGIISNNEKEASLITVLFVDIK